MGSRRRPVGSPGAALKATLEEARGAFRNSTKDFKINKPTRIAFMGDGRGLAASNLIVPNEPTSIYVRSTLETKQHFTVTNSNVTPEFNKPVILGYTDHDPTQEQVLAVHDASIKFMGSAASRFSSSTNNHRVQHQWGGADVVFADQRQLLPGLCTPTNPPGMTVQLNAFVYFYGTWDRFPGEVSADFTQWKPASDSRYILVSFNPTSQLVEYTLGEEFETGGLGEIFGRFGFIPAVPGDSYPLGAILLTSTTTIIDWNAASTDNLMDVRLIISPSLQEILNRLDALEDNLAVETGNDPQVPPLMML